MILLAKPIQLTGLQPAHPYRPTQS